MKRSIADGSVGPPHVRVGHRQDSNKQTHPLRVGFFICVFVVCLLSHGVPHVDAAQGLNLLLQFRHARHPWRTDGGVSKTQDAVFGLGHRQDSIK